MNGEKKSSSVDIVSGELTGKLVVEEDVKEAVERLCEKEGPVGRWRRNGVTLVAGGLVFRQSNSGAQVLLIQEAKESCRGKWYLPMGRVEPGEELKEGAAREVKEESGLEVTVGNLLIASTSKASWHRFIFACLVWGGELKRSEDGESLGAAWFPAQDVLTGKVSLRGPRDTLRSVQIGLVAFRKTLAEGRSRLSWSRLGARDVRQPISFLSYRILLVKADFREIFIHASSQRIPTLALPHYSYKPRFYIVQFLRHLLGPRAELRVRPPILVNVRSQLSSGGEDALCISLLFRMASQNSSAQSWTPPLDDLPKSMPYYSSSSPSCLSLSSCPYKWVPLPTHLQLAFTFLHDHAAPYFCK